MKKIMFAVLASSVFAAPAFADFDEDISLTGTVAVSCTVTGLNPSVPFNALGQNGQVTAVTDSSINVFCNQPSTVSLESEDGYLKLQTSDTDNDSFSETNLISRNNPGFKAGIDYSATIPAFSLTGNTTQLTADTAVEYSQVPALNLTGLSIIYDTLDDATPLLGGTYQDTLTVTLTPNGV
jgi:spore coat protein U-like protein